MLIIMHYYHNSQSHEGDEEDENGFVHFERRRNQRDCQRDASSYTKFMLVDYRTTIKLLIYYLISFIKISY